tara:strand:- start:3857 stop:4018 length:162 start_codon:yes stop_codon:yes gene_type:complete
MGSVFSYEEEPKYKCHTKYVENDLKYVKDKNKNFWLGEKCKRLNIEQNIISSF